MSGNSQLISEINTILQKQEKLIKEIREIKKKVYYKEYYRLKKLRKGEKKVKFIPKDVVIVFD